MRENRTYGSEGGEGNLPDPYPGLRLRVSDAGQRIQPAFAQQRLRVGIAAAEGAIGLGRVAAVAGGVDEFAQALCRRGVEDVAGLFERVESVGVEDLGPEIAVIARRVTVAGEDVLEVRRA